MATCTPLYPLLVGIRLVADAPAVGAIRAGWARDTRHGSVGAVVLRGVAIHGAPALACILTHICVTVPEARRGALARSS